jgi:hypothetical protein
MRIISDIGRFADEVQARIERARRRVDVECFIVRDDRLATRCQPRRPGASPVDCFAIQNFAGSSVFTKRRPRSSGGSTLPTRDRDPAPPTLQR